jgi:alpha-tubulin suppressor-like RCC1 family protein
VCWCWGDNQHGQLGLGIDFLKATGLPPTQVKFFVRLQKKIQDIATGTTFSAFLDGTHLHSSLCFSNHSSRDGMLNLDY